MFSFSNPAATPQQGGQQQQQQPQSSTPFGSNTAASTTRSPRQAASHLAITHRTKHTASSLNRGNNSSSKAHHSPRDCSDRSRSLAHLARNSSHSSSSSSSSRTPDLCSETMRLRRTQHRQVSSRRICLEHPRTTACSGRPHPLGLAGSSSHSPSHRSSARAHLASTPPLPLPSRHSRSRVRCSEVPTTTRLPSISNTALLSHRSSNSTFSSNNSSSSSRQSISRDSIWNSRVKI